MMRKLVIFGILASGIWSCGGEREIEKASDFEAELVWVDSIVVESLFELTLAAVDPDDGRMIFKDRSLKHFLLTDAKGGILDTLKLKGESPDQLAFPIEFVFADGQLIVKDLKANMSLSFFSKEHKITKQSPDLTQAISFLEVNPYWVSFSMLRSEGKKLVVGSEGNGVKPELMTDTWKKAEFYNRAEAGYVYDPNLDSLWRFNSYPENWDYRKGGEWKGQVFPFVQALEEQGLIGILPRVGNQFFIYRWENSKLVLKGETKVSHPDRNDQLEFDPQEDYFLYPSFNDLKSGGNFFLIQFHTEIPKAVRDEFRASNPNYINDPAFGDVFKKYFKDKFILVNHHGESYSLKELPVEGRVHFLDNDDVIYIKPNSEVEKDYNVFYRYQIRSVE